MRAHLSCSIPLPDDFRVGDVLNFHGRDALAVAERIEGHSLQKGLIWEGQAAFLTIRLEIGHADVELAIDGVTNTNQDALIQMVRRMLGLTQRIEDFEYIYRNHPQLVLLCHKTWYDCNVIVTDRWQDGHSQGVQSLYGSFV